ncbi:hypothetical protein [Nocardia sp. NPDC058114]|uniref:hypothetical protein n=1 Tax=Nocardia sp. NPDC058114 TaxID=3346346 RepID=UPI0036DDE719
MSLHNDLDHSLQLRVLPTVKRQAATRAHLERLDGLIGQYRERRVAGTAHPVTDFLFT